MNYQRQALSAGFMVVAALALGCAAKATPGGGGGGDGGQAGTGDGAGGGGDQAGGAAGEAAGGGGSGSGGAANGGAGNPGNGGSQAGAGGSAGNSSGGQGGAVIAGSCASRPYCNDFESAAVGATLAGSRVSNGNTLTVATDKFVSGKQSLSGTASNGEARLSFLVMPGKLVNPKKVTYVRMMVWLDALPGGTGHWDLMAISGAAKQASGGNFQATVSFGGSGDASSRLLYLGGGSDCAKSARPQALALQKWNCLEFKVDETVVGSEYGVNLNGEELSVGTLPVMDNGAVCTTVNPNMNNWYVPDGQTFSVGWQYYHTQVRPVKFWIDDVIVDEMPIGCPP